MSINESTLTGIVRPAPKTPASSATATISRLHIPIPRLQQWAPAWFYSALNWLGKSYYDANNVRQSFNLYMAGSDVDPYASIGSTRLFLIFRTGESFRLSVAPDANSTADATNTTEYANTDEGIREMYLALSNSAVFPSVKFCYVPGRIGPDLNPQSSNRLAAAGSAIVDGYDPASGLRASVLGSAVSQVVPLDDFIKTNNEQIYDPSPAIVPLASAFVYDLSQYNTVGATTFTLPIYYARDRIRAGTDYVNKLGQTVAFGGGPGYNDASATQLQLKTTTAVTSGDYTLTTFTFDKAKVVTTSQVGSKVEVGITELTYSSPSPLSVFAGQQLIGFYCDNAWTNCFGVPMWNYGESNALFSAKTGVVVSPVTIYDPAHGFLNGGSLQNVIRKLDAATYLYPWDQLVAMLKIATTSQPDRRIGLVTTSATLDFKLSSVTSNAPIVDRLDVPIVATVTTTPNQGAGATIPGVRPRADVASLVRTANIAAKLDQIIGAGANQASGAPAGPVTVQAGLTASIPREALDNTGITSVEIGTVFPEQSLGSGAAFKALASGVTVNLMERHNVDPPFAPFDLSFANLGVTFRPGISYVLAATNNALTVRGSDGSNTSAKVNTPDAAHVFVGAFVYGASTTSARLYPKLQLSFNAPAVGTHGVLQGEKYNVRLTYGTGTSTFGLLDLASTPVAQQVNIGSPTPTDKSTPRAGDIYFGSFVGGDANVTVWSVPIFLTVAPENLPGASFDGAMTLDAEVSGVPGYQLQIADSSLFVFSNINVDTRTIGSVSPSNVFLASAIINSSPDDTSAKAFAPCRAIMGLVRQARVGNVLKFVFVPVDDSVVIGSTRYMLSMIELEALDFDPTTRPYPPAAWPSSRYWQFANKHNPYLDVRYTGATQDDRIKQAQQDAESIGKNVAGRGEPIHLYLDTNREQMTMWPIYGFPFDSFTQSIDTGKFLSITNTVLELLAATPAPPTPPDYGSLDAERITLPSELTLGNPYGASIQSDAPAAGIISASLASTAEVAGTAVKNLSAEIITPSKVTSSAQVLGAQALTMQKSAANVAFTKVSLPGISVVQDQLGTSSASEAAIVVTRQRQVIYGFSVSNPKTGEAYLVELVPADQSVFDQLPRPTENLTYDPFYVRVVFLSTLTCYNMSIIVPAMVHDQYGHFGRQGTEYSNLLSKTNELGLAYLYSLFDQNNHFDTLTFNHYPYALESMLESETAIFTNLPYSISGSGVAAKRMRIPTPYFACRRKNWSADCHLMQATHKLNSAAYLAFGAGDLVPLRLDAEFDVDKRSPAHLYKLTYTFSDRQYASAKIVSVSNTPYVVAITTSDAGTPQYMNFSLNAKAGTADLEITNSTRLQFPTEIQVVGQASTTLISINDINAKLSTTLGDTGDLLTLDLFGQPVGTQEFALIAYNNLVYMIRAVSNNVALGQVGGLGTVSGLLIDTFVPTTNGNLARAQGARHKRSQMQFFGATYTPATMVDALDNLDFASITGETFYAPTIFIPIPEIDATKGFVADISNFLGQQFWTFIYPEIAAKAGTTSNGVTWDHDVNIDSEGKPVLPLQKLHFVYDPQVVLFTPNDLTHKYSLMPKQQVLALTNGQIQEGICWRSANVQPQRLPPTNICAQQILPAGDGMDRPNIVYSSHNRPVETSVSSSYMGMSVNSVLSVSGTVYAIEESALQNDQTGTSFVSQVSSTTNMVVGVLFDYDNNDLGTFGVDPNADTTKGMVFLNGYLSAAGYTFSSPDHFDVNDVLPSQVPLLEQIADTMGFDVAFFNTDVSLPRQFWSMTYDTFTAPGVPNFIPNVPPSLVDPSFSNRTRSLVLSLQNPVHPQQLGMMDTYSSVVSANLHLANGVTGSVFLSKKADRDVASIGTNPVGRTTFPLYGLPTKYDFFIFSRDHYWTLKGASFELIDQGYAMCLIDDGTGTGTKVAKYFIDSDGNYYELYTYVLYSPNGGVIESQSFTLRVTLGTPANLAATPIIPETPNSVNPQDLVAQINKVSNLIYAAFGPSSPGQPPAYLPIQAVGGTVQAAPIVGPPGFSGYLLNVAAANRQPVPISQIYLGNVTYAMAGSTTIVPINPKSGKVIPFYGSISHGLDRMLPATLQSSTPADVIPRPTVPPGPATGLFGGNGLGAMVGTPMSCAFQGSGAVPPAIASNPTPGTTMKADDTVFYTYNAATNYMMDSTGKQSSPSAGQYFIDATDPQNPIYAVVTMPKFTFNGNTYNVNLSTTLADGVTSRYSLVIGGKSYLFGPDNAHVTVDRTTFTFNPIKGGVYTVEYSSVDQPTGDVVPSPISLTQFAITMGGVVATLDVFNNPGSLNNVVLGVTGRQYSYDPIHGTVTIHDGANTTTVPIQTGLVAPSISGYGYVIGFDETAGGYTVNGRAVYQYSATTTGAPATHALMTAPQMFTLGGNFYTFDKDSTGVYVTVTGNQQTIPINPYQFSLNGSIYIINTNVQPNTVIGGGNTYAMTAGNTQFVINGVQYTITLKAGSLSGATISGQYNITQGNVVVIENFVYEIDTLNGQIVGNGTAYPLTSSGVTYTISTADRSFTVTTEPNATTVTTGNVVYEINNTTVVGDGIVYPILPYRSFVDGTTTYSIGSDGVVSIPTPFTLSGSSPFTRSTFTDGGATYTVNDIAAYDGTNYYRMTGTPAQFAAGGRTYTVRNDEVTVTAGATKTYLGPTTGALTPNQFQFGTKTIHLGRASDVAAFDGQHYYAISNSQFTDSNTGNTFTLSGNTAVHEGNSYEIFSFLGVGAYFEVPGGPVYYVNIPVADTGNASGDIFNVFPVTSGGFTTPLRYTITVAGGVVTIDGFTFTGGPTVVNTLTASGSSLTGGEFVDPVTKISYTCVVNGSEITFIDSNNVAYPFPATGTTNELIVSVVIATGVTVAVDDQGTPNVYPVLNNQFIAGASTYSINVPIAYTNAAGPYYSMVNGRFIVPGAGAISSVAYTVRGGNIVKGYVISADDEFSADGNVVYTINAVNVIKSTNQATLAGAEPTQTLTAGTLTYTLDTNQHQARVQLGGVSYNTTTKQFTANINGIPVTYTATASGASDDRKPQNTFTVTAAGSVLTFTDTTCGVTFSFDSSGNNQVTAAFAYTNHFFVDGITGVTYYIDEADNRVEAISYIAENTQYAFTPSDGKVYLIHYDDVRVEFPVIAGANVNAGIAAVGANTFTVEIDEVNPLLGGPPIPINQNSFEINGDLYTISGTPNGTDYSACSVVGEGAAPRAFVSANTFKLTDPNITYTLHLDPSNLPLSISATFPIKPSRDLINVNDDVYLITYNTVSTGTLLGQGQASIPISNSGFTLSNRFDSTKAKFTFADLDIFDAASVVGVFAVYLAPTFILAGQTYTLDPVQLVVTDNNKRPYPLLPNPTMFSISGFNYVIDTNQTPHAIVGNNNVSPLATDVTVESGHPIPHSTFTLNGQVYAYTEDSTQNLLAITNTKSYMIAQPALTFKLDSSLVFTLSTAAPAAGNYAGTVVPIGTVTAGTTVLNVYPGTPESGGADFFTYKNVLYTLVKSAGNYVAVQKAYTVYASKPAATQQQLAVFDLNGTTYMVTDGTTKGDASPAGINPGTMWAATSVSSVETQFGLVYGFASPPTNVARSGTGLFQFQATDPSGVVTLYDIVYTAGGNANVVKIDIPALLPTFTQIAPFTFTASYPLTFETGGYNAFTTFVTETSTPSLSFAGAYKTPVTSTDSLVDSLIGEQGDFGVEFWHSIPPSLPLAYHPFTYAANTADPLVHFIDINFQDDANIYLQVNDTVMHATSTPPVFSSGWRHIALTYTQPYTMLCQGGGFEVKKGSNYNFNRDFSIAMTFSISDVNTTQGLLYKGMGSDNTTPQNAMSYRVGVSGGQVTLQLTDAENNVSPLFLGPTISPNQFYQLIIVKHTTTPAGRDDSADPYAAPFDTTDMGTIASNGMSTHASGFPSGGGDITVSDIKPAGQGANTRSMQFLNSLGTVPSKAYNVVISVREVNTNGTFTDWVSASTDQTATSDTGLAVNSTGGAHLLIGEAFGDDGSAQPLGSVNGAVGNIRDVYLFNGAIDRTGIRKDDGTIIDIASASNDDLVKAGMVGVWVAKYAPDGVISNPYDADAFAITTNSSKAMLAPLAHREREGIALCVNGYPMTLQLEAGLNVPGSMTGFSPGNRQLTFSAGQYRLAEISIWKMARQPYQVIDDMFGRLIPSNEPFLLLYLSGSFMVTEINAPILPMNKYIDNIAVTNPVTSMNLALSNASLDLAGCPAVGRCGPLITPNLYTPPGVALTVCDTVPLLSTYSVTLNTLTAGLAGEINEAYVYIKNNVLTLYAGKKVGDLVLSWVSQEQGNVQLIGYIEGAPPAPMANLTNKTSYAGATSITFSAPTSITLKLQSGYDSSEENKLDYSDAPGFRYGLGTVIAPFGAGFKTDGDGTILAVNVGLGVGGSYTWTDGNGSQSTASNKLDESNKYTVKLQGTLAPVTGDQFMANLNSYTTQSTTAGTTASKNAILPNPNLGGFTNSNPPAALPKAPTDEKFGSRMYVPSSYGQAFVTSQTLDVYQQTLLQTNTVFGFVRIPNAQIPRDLNIVSFRINSQYLRPGVIDGVIGYAYNPATLPGGAQTYTTSTGEMQVLNDKNFSAGEVGHDASYMRVVEAYKLKRQIDQQAFNALALYQSQYNANAWPDDSRLTPGLDFYNEYIWTTRGGTQEVKHTYTTSYDEVYTTTSGNSAMANINFNVKLSAATITIIDFKFGYTYTSKFTIKSSYNTTGTSSFDISASFDGLESDTQMRYACNNDAHFVMKFNSMYNQNNQSGLNLVIGSDGLVYNIVPNVSSGAGLPTSNNLDDSQTYMQPQPAYTSGNADGNTGALEPYDRPGKIKQFRTYTFFLQPTSENADNFWNQVVDPIWLANSDEADAAAMREAQQHVSIPWRVLYRVTYCERFLPPVSTEAIVVPQITPVMAVPVLNPPSDFIFKRIDLPGPRPARNPLNDVEANVVLAAPTMSGASAGTIATSGPNTGLPILPNNVIPFDLVKGMSSIVNWGDSANAKLLSQLTTSVLGLNTVQMVHAVPGSTKLYDVMDPVAGGVLYSVYQDPNGLTVNVQGKSGITVYQDVNGNPIQFYDGKTFHSLQADYIATADGTVMYYIEPPSTYDQSVFDITGDYDLFGHPGDQWRYYLVSGVSANMTAEATVTGAGPFLSSGGYTGFQIASKGHAGSGANQVQGYVLAQGILEWPHLNTNSETFADVQVYKSMSLLDTFPIGDPEVLIAFLKAQFSTAPFVENEEICLVFARNIVSYFNGLQQALIPQ